jgi:translation elongation factor EF-Ts
MAGRVGVYVHSDSVSPDKGGCMVVVSTATDFASRTDQVKAFADKVAKYSYGASASYKSTWLTFHQVKKVFPELETERIALSKELREEVAITNIKFVKV